MAIQIAKLAGAFVFVVASNADKAEKAKALGADVVEFVGFPDHHAYDDHDRRRLGDRAAMAGAAFAVTTLKDLVKVRRQDLGGVPLVAVEIAMLALAGGDEVAAVVAAAAHTTSSRGQSR